jgi:hypothetical protein
MRLLRGSKSIDPVRSPRALWTQSPYMKKLPYVRRFIQHDRAPTAATQEAARRARLSYSSPVRYSTCQTAWSSNSARVLRRTANRQLVALSVPDHQADISAPAATGARPETARPHGIREVRAKRKRSRNRAGITTRLAAANTLNRVRHPARDADAHPRPEISDAQLRDPSMHARELSNCSLNKRSYLTHASAKPATNDLQTPGARAWIEVGVHPSTPAFTRSFRDGASCRARPPTTSASP